MGSYEKFKEMRNKTVTVFFDGIDQTISDQGDEITTLFRERGEALLQLESLQSQYSAQTTELGEANRQAEQLRLEREVARDELKQTRAIMDRQTGEIVAKDELIRLLEAQLEACIRSHDEPDSGKWEQIYATDFEGPGTAWVARNEAQDNDDSRNLPRNAVYGDGLTIYFKREKYTQGSVTKEFTTADVCGTGVPIPNYFAAEIEARMPHKQGLWPCPLWFRPLNGGAGEIDVIELFGSYRWTKATLHDDYSKGVRMNGKGIDWTIVPEPEGYHTYRIEKTPGRILISIKDLGIELANFKREDAPSNFAWDTLFENVNRLWYPRITAQIGHGNQVGSNVGLPTNNWREDTMHAKKLKIWKLSV